MRQVVLRFIIACVVMVISAFLLMPFIPEKQNAKKQEDQIRLIRAYEVCSDIKCYEIEINGDTITACDVK